MEFYKLQRASERSTISFNSQRDGILPRLRWNTWSAASVSIPNEMEFYRSLNLPYASLRVSIPNGMEFYIYAALVSAVDLSFNSQRDGILRFCRGIEIYLVGVSIPNGMEFYALFLIVSSEIWISFNSQRDGILPIRPKRRRDRGRFQFPTGWNSTLGYDLAPPAQGFQFPTGWNSTCR